jgi:prepilin-type N-terminal cleavage/methylation domain-containing protein/prepilin-type processing-associated H-X9-DG protein
MRFVTAKCRCCLTANTRSRVRRGFTLVELLVVIAVMGILIALLLPAVQSARESARMIQCKNHLKQIGLAWLHHHDTQGFFPTGGWGSNWTGDPDRGFDKRQPGGWAYNTLPFLEEEQVHDLGQRMSYGAHPDKKDVLAQATQSAATLFLCPSRRPQTEPFIFTRQAATLANINLKTTSNVWRGDYSANAGDQMWNTDLASPITVAQVHDPKFKFDPTDNPKLHGYSTGVSYYQSTVSIRQIAGGASHKYMVGEKFLLTDKYFTGDDLGDNDWLWTGWDQDLYRTAGINYQSANSPPTPSTPSPIPPQRDTSSSDADPTTKKYAINMWGSPHAAGFNMVFCDGSVHTLEYGIDLLVHRWNHNRDGY